MKPYIADPDGEIRDLVAEVTRMGAEDMEKNVRVKINGTVYD